MLETLYTRSSLRVGLINTPTLWRVTLQSLEFQPDSWLEIASAFIIHDTAVEAMTCSYKLDFEVGLP